MNRELEQENESYLQNYRSIKNEDYDELVRRLHQAEKRLLLQSKTDIETLAGLKPSRIILEFDHVEHK